MPPPHRPRALIVEDEAALAEELRGLLSTVWPQLDVCGVATDGVSALNLAARAKPEVAFLDIGIPGPSGLDIAESLAAGGARIVFVTAHDHYALAAFDKGAVDYLVKPIDPVRLARTVLRLRQPAAAPGTTVRAEPAPSSAARPLRWIRATVGASLRLVMVDDIVYFQAERNYTRVLLAESEVLIRTPLKELLERLDSEQFWQVHRSTIVNVFAIADLTRDLRGRLVIRLKNRRESVPVSDSFAFRFREM
jgi:DNA-binding LytR/AlgR family response regulator